MKFMGKNSIFTLRMSIQVSEENIIGIASGTAMTLKALPIPQPIDIKVDKYFQKRELQNKFEHDQLFNEIQQKSKSNLELNFKMPIFKIFEANEEEQKEN